MGKLPEWRREGWYPAGPGVCRCPTCRESVTTNALGRASHMEKHRREAAGRDKPAEPLPNCPPKPASEPLPTLPGLTDRQVRD